MLPPIQHSCADKRAFSLIETAIVLAVVGLILGGLWVAAQTVNENRKQSETLQGILKIIEDGRLFWGQSWAMPTGLFYSNDVGNTTAAISAKVPPASWVTSPTTIVNPYGLQSYIRAGAYPNPALSPTTIAVFLELPSAAVANKIIYFFSGSNFNRYRVLSTSCYLWNGSAQSSSYLGTSAASLPTCPSPSAGYQLHLTIAFYP